MRLLELFDSPAKFNTKKTDNGYFVDFSIDDMSYTAQIWLTMPESVEAMNFIGYHPMEQPEKFEQKLSRHPVYEVSFRIKNSDNYDISGTGNQFKVFTTILHALAIVIQNDNPIELQFDSKEKSRTKLYDTLVRKLSSQFGYVDKSVGRIGGRSKDYVLVSKDIIKPEN